MSTLYKSRVAAVVFALGLSLASLSYATEQEGEEESLAEQTEPERPTANLNVSLYSQYIWRGYELSKNSAVFFPSLTVAYKGFSCNVWADLDTDYNHPQALVDAEGQPIDSEMRLWETDLVLSYANSISKLNYTLGWIYYDTNGYSAREDVKNQEVFLILGWDWSLLNPSFSVWREIELGPSWYLNLALSHSIGFDNGWSLDIGGWVSYMDSERDGYRSWHDGNLWAGLNIPLNKYFTLTPKVQYSFPLSSGADHNLQASSFDGGDSQFVYGGLILDVSI
jgi:uncharacterized protein (TIGR02001 family)